MVMVVTDKKLESFERVTTHIPGVQLNWGQRATGDDNGLEFGKDWSHGKRGIQAGELQGRRRSRSIRAMGQLLKQLRQSACMAKEASNDNSCRAAETAKVYATQRST
eukprot:1157930-Pelagomonas_calceolata.AAC.9